MRSILTSVHMVPRFFFIWLVEGQSPNGRILDADDPDQLEEERRLFYFALTRAKDEPYLTYPMLNPKSYSGDIICRPSRFLEDFPVELVEEWNVGNSDL